MTNPYYAHTSGVPATLTRAASSQIRNEYDLIEDGFDLIDAAIDAKANIDSPTFTGTVTVPTPLTAAAAATKAYVDALSVAAGNVPAGGSTGQYLVKDSATDFDMSWGSIVSVGTGGTTSTASITLTASSAAAMSVTPATPGLYVTLPDATTCTKADNLYAVYNAGDFDYGVKDSAGTQLGWIRARTGAMIGLADNATAAGVWAYYGLEKTGITASYVNSTLTNMGNTIRRIALDANRTCFLFGGTDCYGIVYDASTQTWGSATLVRSSITSGLFQGILSATNQILVVSVASAGAMSTVTLTISGTGVTVNSPVATAIADCALVGQLVACGASWVFAYTRTSGPQVEARAITLAGTVPTIGAAAVPTGGSSTLPIMFVSGSVVRFVLTDGAGTTLYCTPYTVSGTGFSIGTGVTRSTTAAAFRAFLNGNGNIVCHYINTTHFATIFKLTGTVEAASSVSLGTAPSTITGSSDYVSVTASKTVFISGSWYANILTDTAGTASAGTEISQVVLGTMSALSGLTSSGNTARFATASTQSNGVIQQVSLDCSGTSPTISSIQQITYFGPTSGGTINSLPSASDIYGVRQPRTLIAGSRAHLLGGSAVSYDLSMTTTGVQFNKPVPTFSATSNVTGVAGAANSESFIAISLNNSTTGYIINRVEAAA